MTTPGKRPVRVKAVCLYGVKEIRQPNNRGRGPSRIVRCGEPLTWGKTCWRHACASEVYQALAGLVALFTFVLATERSDEPHGDACNCDQCMYLHQDMRALGEEETP